MEIGKSRILIIANRAAGQPIELMNIAGIGNCLCPEAGDSQDAADECEVIINLP